LKFSWGKGLLVSYLVFIIIVLTMVGITITKDVDLVTPNYYEKEIKYQEEINKIINTGRLKDTVKFEVSESSLMIHFPVISESSTIKGEVNFYRPSDSKKDFKIQVMPDKEHKQVFDITNIEKGLWKVKVNWSMDGIDYLSNSMFVKQ
jgi:hypothetical protein